MSEANQMKAGSLRILFGSFAVSEVMLRRAFEVLDNKTFPELYAPHRFFYTTIKEHWEEFHKLPSIDMLRSRLSAGLRNEFIDDDGEQECTEIFECAKCLSAEEPEVLERIANQYLDNFIDSLFREDLGFALSQNEGLAVILSKFQQDLLYSQATNQDRFASPFGASLDRRPAGRFTLTGNMLVDLYTGGTGPATGDIIGHAAPRGSGKSTLADSIACDVSHNELESAKKEGRPPRWVYIFNYEKIEDPLTHALSYTAGIPRATIEQFIYAKDLTGFSTKKKYKLYEKQRFRQLINLAKVGKSPWPKTELRRFESAREKLSQNLMIADFTGRDPSFAKLATSFVQGISEFIQSHQLKHGNPGVEAVFVDYASTCARAKMRDEKNPGESRERKLIEDLPFQLKQMVANPMQCFVWVAHQLAAEEASKKGGTRPDPNKFKDCKSFAENCDYCIVNGIPTHDGLAIFVHSKTRRGRQQPDQVGRLDGEYSNWTSAASDYVIASGRIISRKDAQLMYQDSGSIGPDMD